MDQKQKVAEIKKRLAKSSVKTKNPANKMKDFALDSLNRSVSMLDPINPLANNAEKD